MVQLLNAAARWVNPISRDFERFNIPNKGVIELLDFDEHKVIDCVRMAIDNFELAKQQFNQPVPLHFKTTRNIVYNLLCYLEFGAILKHVKVNREVYGDRLLFYKELVIAFLLAPFTLIKNIFLKKVIKNK
jgi:hypothetical protein